VAIILVIDKTKKPDSFCYRAFRTSQIAALAVFIEAYSLPRARKLIVKSAQGRNYANSALLSNTVSNQLGALLTTHP
jgi:hypothetical protein